LGLGSNREVGAAPLAVGGAEDPKSVEIDPDMGEVTTLVTASHLVVEIEDLKRDLLGSGVSEEELAERVAPGVSGF